MKKKNLIKTVLLSVIFACVIVLCRHYNINTYIEIFLAAIFISLSGFLNYTDGAIRINSEDPEKDIYTLEIGIPLGELDKRNTVIFRVYHE